MLMFANKIKAGIILEKELEELLSNPFAIIISDEKVKEFQKSF